MLSQGSTHHQRVFIAKKSERDIICNLCTGVIDMETFINDERLSSENALLIKSLIVYIQEKWPLAIPNQYVKFITECCKGSPVAGLLQCSSSEPLKILNEFANRKINLRDANNLDSAKKMSCSLPSFWLIIIDILKLEKEDFPADIVCKIIKVLIFIRRKTFLDAPIRFKKVESPYT